MSDYENERVNENMEDRNNDSRELLKRLAEEGFDGDVPAVALALGREEDQIADMMAGEAEIDEDLEMKVHALVQERGFDPN